MVEQVMEDSAGFGSAHFEFGKNLENDPSFSEKKHLPPLPFGPPSQTAELTPATPPRVQKIAVMQDQR